MKTRCRFRAIPTILALVFSGTSQLSAATDQTASTLGFNESLWSNPAHWTSTPTAGLVPNNGNGGFTYRAEVLYDHNLDMDVTLDEFAILPSAPYYTTTLTGTRSAQHGT